MFINCPHCRALIATDPATDLPPERCPRCAAILRLPVQAAQAGEDRTPAPLEISPPAADTIVAPPDDASAAPADTVADTVADTRAEAPATVDVTESATPPEIETAPLETDAETTPADALPAPSTDTTPIEPLIETSADIPSNSASSPSTSPSVETSVSAAAASAIAADAAAPLQHPPADTASEPESPSTQAVAPTVPHRDKPAPSFARVRKPVVATSARQRWLLPSLIAGLSLLLALQWVLADRARLAADAHWRPLLAQLCGVLRCSLPPWREPAAFALLDRDVRPHPGVPGALRVTATFRNDARWPQPWPEVVLTLSDVDGQAVGARTFAAGEYLGASPTQNALSSGQTATIRMDVLEPAPHIVAFAFDFR